LFLSFQDFRDLYYLAKIESLMKQMTPLCRPAGDEGSSHKQK
jgi:hypothetical protein